MESKKLIIHLQVCCVHTSWHLLSKCKTLQFDGRTLRDGHDFGELHFDLWLVFAHHACMYREKSRDDAMYIQREFFSAQGLNRSHCVKINIEVRTWLCMQYITTVAQGKLSYRVVFLTKTILKLWFKTQVLTNGTLTAFPGCFDSANI